MKSRMKRINYDGVTSLSASTNVNVDDSEKNSGKSSILSANARLRQKDMLRKSNVKLSYESAAET